MHHKTATDFRKSLEARLQGISKKSGEDLQRLRRKVAFDRLLARVFSEENTGFFLKGGYAMELRSVEARTTKDIDLTTTQDFTTLLQRLQMLARKNLHDYFIYRISEATQDLENAPYGGSRFPIATLIDNRLFVQFQLDVGADIIADRVESIKGTNWLEYCNIPPPTIWMISAKQQFCEKLHAYTLPREGRINSRSKDLVDMILLLNMHSFNPNEFFPTLDRIFRTRNTHPLPERLLPPPKEWKTQFSAMAEECGLSYTIDESFVQVGDFYSSIMIAEPTHSI